MKTNIKKNRIAWVGSSILMALVVVGCVYLDKVNINQGTEENPIYWTKAGEIATFTIDAAYRMCTRSNEKISYGNLSSEKLGMHVRIRQ